MLSNAVLALSFLPLTLAHFQLNWPESRGFTDDTEGTFPCGGYNDVQQDRTDFPISGGPIQLNMGHPQTNIAVYMAIGDNPGSGFSIVAQQQLMVDGLGDFCLGSVSVPDGVNVTSGTKASIQVVTNAHGSGGLYQVSHLNKRDAPRAESLTTLQCADVTLVDDVLSQSDYDNHCKNNTGVKVSQENISGNPNGTSTGDAEPSSASGSASPDATGAATQAKAISWMLGAAGLAGMAML